MVNLNSLYRGFDKLETSNLQILPAVYIVDWLKMIGIAKICEITIYTVNYVFSIRGKFIGKVTFIVKAIHGNELASMTIRRKTSEKTGQAVLNQLSLFRFFLLCLNRKNVDSFLFDLFLISSAVTLHNHIYFLS